MAEGSTQEPAGASTKAYGGTICDTVIYHQKYRFGVSGPGTELLTPLDFGAMRVIKVSFVIFLR